MTQTLPVIDIEPLRLMSDKAMIADTAARIDAACREFGFFYAAGHGIDPAIVANLLATSEAFFALPEHEKAAIAMDKGGIAWRGWFPVAGELTSGIPDLKEGLYLGEELGASDPRVAARLPLHGANLWPGAVPALRPAVEAYLAAATRAGEGLMRGMALALGFEADHFARGLTRHPTLLFRIFHYPATMGAAGVEPLPIDTADGQPGEARWDGIDFHKSIGTYGDYLIGKVSKVFPELADARLERDR